MSHELLERVAVRAPYYGLEDLSCQQPGFVDARVPNAPPMAPEVGPLPGAQIARHLAILGSLACASMRDDDKQHYYLATSAHYVRVPGSPLSVSGPLLAEAFGAWSDKRSARAVAKLHATSGEALHVLDVTYAVVTPRLFSKLYPAETAQCERARGDTFDVLPSPKASVVDGVATADCGVVDAAACAGHFEGAPTAPVAIVMGQLTHTCAAVMHERLGRCAPFVISNGIVSASKLARAGQHLTMTARHVEWVDGDHRMVGEAHADGEPVGSVDVTLTVVPDAEDPA